MVYEHSNLDEMQEYMDNLPVHTPGEDLIQYGPYQGQSFNQLFDLFVDSNPVDARRARLWVCGEMTKSYRVCSPLVVP